MKEAAHRLVQRAAITLTLQQPYIDWANSLDDDRVIFGVDFWPEKHIYLVEAIGDHLLDKEAIIRPYYQTIFEEELNSWHRRESDWPAQRDFKAFLDWFDAEVHSMILEMRNRWLIPTETMSATSGLLGYSPRF